MTMTDTRRLFLRLCGGFAALLSLPLCSGLTILLNSPEQFTVGKTEALACGALALLLLSTALALPPLALPRKGTRHLPALLLALTLDVFLQLHLWNEVFPDYRPESLLSWDFLLQAALHAALLALPFLVAWRLRDAVGRHACRLSAIVLLSQACQLLLTCANSQEPQYDFRSHSFTEEGKFTFGNRDNAIVMVVDCMGEGICKEVLEKWPELQETLRDFTCFDRMVSPLPRTMFAVPAMLTGINFPRRELRVPAEDVDHGDYLARVCKADTSLFSALKAKGFRTEGYPFLLATISYAPDVIDNSIPAYLEYKTGSYAKFASILLDRLVPFFIKALGDSMEELPFLTFERRRPDEPRLTFDQTFRQRLQTEARLGEQPAVFKYLHLQGAHEPVLLDETLQRNRQSLKYRQLRGSLRNFELLVDTLKRLGRYDDATLILVGDHTERYDIHTIAFVKLPHERHDAMRLNSTSCQASDVAGTVLAAYGIDSPLKSLFDLPPVPGDGSVRPEQQRYLAIDTWTPVHTPLPESNDLQSIRQRFEGGAVILEDFWYLLDTPLTLLLADPDGQTAFRAEVRPPQDYPCVRTTFGGIPDGTYTMTVLYNGQTVFQELLGQCVIRLPYPIAIRDGKAWPPKMP